MPNMFSGIVFGSKRESVLKLRCGNFSSELWCFCVRRVHRGHLLCCWCKLLRGLWRWDLPGFHWIPQLFIMRIGSLLYCGRCHFPVVVFGVHSRQFCRFGRRVDLLGLSCWLLCGRGGCGQLFELYCGLLSSRYRGHNVY